MTDPGRRRWRVSRRLLVSTAAVIVAVVVLAVLWSGSDYANTSVRTAAEATARPDADPADEVSAQWRAPSTPTAANPVQDGTVVVAETHGLRGLDPVTGDERWHYLRSTALLCDWTAEDGVVVAAFRGGERGDGCDEALALDAGTGLRVWYRNVSLRDDVQLASTNQLTVGSTPTGLTAFGTTYNGLRWRYRPPEGCSIAHSMPGDVGVAVVLTCDGAPSLVLLDGFTGEAKWTGVLPPGPARLLTASGVVAVSTTDLTGALQVFDRQGVLTVSLRDPSLVGPEGADPSALLVGDRLAVFTGSALVAVDTGEGVVGWVARATTRPTLVTAGLLVFDGTDFVELDVRTGLAVRTITIDGPAPAPGGALSRIGAAIVVGTPADTAIYR